MYVEDLIGPDTVNTMPPQTVEAFRDHGTVKRTVDTNVEEAERTKRPVVVLVGDEYHGFNR